MPAFRVCFFFGYIRSESFKVACFKEKLVVPLTAPCPVLQPAWLRCSAGMAIREPLAWLYVSRSMGRALPSQTKVLSCHIASFMKPEPWTKSAAPPSSAPHVSRQLHTCHSYCCRSWDRFVASRHFCHFVPIRKVEKSENVVFSYRVAVPSLGQPQRAMSTLMNQSAAVGSRGLMSGSVFLIYSLKGISSHMNYPGHSTSA